MIEDMRKDPSVAAILANESHEMHWCMKTAVWSDLFFHYAPAEQVAYDDKPGLLDAAKMFLEANSDCPFSAEWLAEDFNRRL